MDRVTYDAVFSLGSTCGCAIALRESGRRIAAGPLDWVGGAASLSERVALVESRFDGWMRPEWLRHGEVQERYDVVRNDRLGVRFPHDFPVGLSWEQALAGAQARHRRRQERFFRTVAGAARVLLVYCNPLGPPSLPGEAESALRRLRAALGEQVDLMVLDPAEDLPPGASRRVPSGPGLVCLQVGFWRGRPDIGRLLGDEPEAVLALFRQIPMADAAVRANLRRLARRRRLLFLRKLVARVMPTRRLRRAVRGKDRGW